MERLTEAVNFLLRRHIKTADPAVRQEGEQHLANIAELTAEHKPMTTGEAVQHIQEMVKRPQPEPAAPETVAPKE